MTVDQQTTKDDDDIHQQLMQQQQSQQQQMEYYKVQHDFAIDMMNAYSNSTAGTDAFWISLYNHDPATIHANVACTGKITSTNTIQMKSDYSGFQVSSVDETSFSISTSGNLPVLMKSACKTIDFGSRITALGYSPSASLIIVGGTNGALRVLNAPVKSSSPDTTPTPVDSSTRLELRGHLGDITTAKFFPSGQVMLTSATDLTIKVWGMAGENPVTLGGARMGDSNAFVPHTRPVTDTGIIGRGKNIITCARDGSAWLWELATATPILDLAPQRIRTSSTSINAVSVGQMPANSTWASSFYNPSESWQSGPREFETADKLAFFACENGSLFGFDLRDKSECIMLPTSSSSPAASVSFDAIGGYLASGSSNGLVELYDLRNYSNPICVFSRNEASINKLFLLPKTQTNDNSHRIIFANDEGSTAMVNVDAAGRSSVAVEYAGVDIEPLVALDVNVDETAGVVNVISGGREGILRKYI